MPHQTISGPSGYGYKAGEGFVVTIMSPHQNTPAIITVSEKEKDVARCQVAKSYMRVFSNIFFSDNFIIDK